MTPRDAQKRIVKLLGKRAMWRDSGRRTSPEQRAVADEESRAARKHREAVRDALDARSRELLKNDAEYQRLAADYKAAHAAERAAGSGGGYRIMVGLNMGFACEVKAQGDNWAEVVRALEERKPGEWTPARVS